MILGSAPAISAVVCEEKLQPASRIRTSRLDGGSTRCSASRARTQRKDFSPLTLLSSTPSTSNATSLPLQRIKHSSCHGDEHVTRGSHGCLKLQELPIIVLFRRQRDKAISPLSAPSRQRPRLARSRRLESTLRIATAKVAGGRASVVVNLPDPEGANPPEQTIFS